MAEFLTTAGTSHRLEQLVTSARASLKLISPYLQFSRILLERLGDARKRGVEIVVVCRKADLKHKEREQLTAVDGLKLYFMENLHAKCYISEAGVVITSMNLYHHSEQQNREMGVYFGSDEAPYLAAAAEVESILASARANEAPAKRPQFGKEREQRPAPRNSPFTGSFTGGQRSSREEKTRVFTGSFGRVEVIADDHGHCVRCRSHIDIDRSRPLCESCFGVWVEFENADYPERWCHVCGERNDTSYRYPLCNACFSRQ